MDKQQSGSNDFWRKIARMTLVLYSLRYSNYTLYPPSSPLLCGLDFSLFIARWNTA